MCILQNCYNFTVFQTRRSYYFIAADGSNIFVTVLIYYCYKYVHDCIHWCIYILYFFRVIHALNHWLLIFKVLCVYYVFSRHTRTELLRIRVGDHRSSAIEMHEQEFAVSQLFVHSSYLNMMFMHYGRKYDFFTLQSVKNAKTGYQLYLQIFQTWSSMK